MLVCTRREANANDLSGAMVVASEDASGCVDCQRISYLPLAGPTVPVSIRFVAEPWLGLAKPLPVGGG